MKALRTIVVIFLVLSLSGALPAVQSCPCDYNRQERMQRSEMEEPPYCTDPPQKGNSGRTMTDRAVLLLPARFCCIGDSNQSLFTPAGSSCLEEPSLRQNIDSRCCGTINLQSCETSKAVPPNKNVPLKRLSGMKHISNSANLNQIYTPGKTVKIPLSNSDSHRFTQRIYLNLSALLI